MTNVEEVLTVEMTEDLLVVQDHVTTQTTKVSKCGVRDLDLEMTVDEERDPDLETILRYESDQGQETMTRLIDVQSIQQDYDPSIPLATKGQRMQRRAHLQFLKRLEVPLIVGSSLSRKLNRR